MFNEYEVRYQYDGMATPEKVIFGTIAEVKNHINVLERFHGKVNYIVYEIKRTRVDL